MSSNEIQELEKKIFELTAELNALRKKARGESVPDYEFDTLDGTVRLSELFGSKDKLLLIHNMGQGCRYCTLWGDGFSPFIPHLESAMSVAMVSKDTPAVQRNFANSRGWRFRMASHGGGDYISEQTVMEGQSNMPGAVVYERDGDRILRKNACVFGPGDLYCSAWGLLALAGHDASDWTPQYNYWSRPQQLDDGGDNVVN